MGHVRVMQQLDTLRSSTEHAARGGQSGPELHRRNGRTRLGAEEDCSSPNFIARAINKLTERHALRGVADQRFSRAHY